MIPDWMRSPLWAPDDEGAGEGEGNGGGDAGEGTPDGQDAAKAGEAGGKAEAAPADTPPDGAEAKATETDWRASITDGKLRDHAGRFASVTDLVKGNLDLRSERDRIKSTSLVVPGKDASEEEVADFRKKLGVPEGPDGYDFLAPGEGEELSDFEKQSREAWMQRFHEFGVPKEQAQKIVEAWREDMAENETAVSEADAQFARETERTLKQEWGEDFDRNKGIASSAARDLFGEDFEDMKQAQTKDGRLLMDHPAMLRMLARVGREMQEGSMGAMTDDQRDTLEEQANEARNKRNEAMARGDRLTAQRWDERERELLGKIGGSGPIVGSMGRVA